jgi:hypothetical protein
MNEVVTAHELFTLGAFTGSGWAKQDDIEHNLRAVEAIEGAKIR